MRQEERDQGGGRNVPVSAAIGGVMQRSKSPDIAVGAIDVRTFSTSNRAISNRSL